MNKKKNNKTVISIYKPVEFPIINNDELALELDVETLAKKNARLNIPDTAASEPDSNELNLRSKLESYMLQAQNRVEESVSVFRNTISQASASKELSTAYELPNEFEKYLSTELSTKLDDIRAEKENFQTACDDLQVFKKQNELRRMHHYPDSQYSTYAFFILAIIIESALNGVFFAEGSDSGLVGGVGTALVIACINVSIGGAVGAFSLRYKNHCKQWKVILGWCGFAIFTIISLIFNLLVAHYRTAMIQQPDNAASQAMETFSQGITAIADVQSWLLCLLGIGFYFAAVYKGYKADDAYPGYGALARKRDKLQGYLSDDKSSADILIQETHEKFASKLESCYQDIAKKSKKVHDGVSGFRHQKTILESYHKHLQNALKFILTLYRDVNASHRTTDKPAFFNQPIDAILDYREIELEFDYQTKLDELSESKAKLDERLSGIRQKLLDIKEKYQNIVNEKAGV